ncbi:hypothetical protein ACROYT_G019550 [Oculina patagonica]
MFDWGLLQDKEETRPWLLWIGFCGKSEGGEGRDKEILSDENTEKRLFLKEAKILQGITSEHVVKFKAACIEPCAMMLEYLYFDFAPFGVSQKLELEKVQTGNSLSVLERLISKNEKPAHSDYYCIEHATSCLRLRKLHDHCTRFNPKDRPDAKYVVDILGNEAQGNSRDIAFKVSQGSSVENANCSNIPDDGTNACAFMSVHFGELLICLNERMAISKFEDISRVAEDVIINSPLKFNPFRDKGRHYDVLEAYGLLRESKVVEEEYEFTEEILGNHGAYTGSAREELMAAVFRLTTETKMRIAFYSCGGYIFTIGWALGQLFIMDTHVMPGEPVVTATGGEGFLQTTARSSADTAWTTCLKFEPADRKGNELCKKRLNLDSKTSNVLDPTVLDSSEEDVQQCVRNSSVPVANSHSNKVSDAPVPSPSNGERADGVDHSRASISSGSEGESRNNKVSDEDDGVAVSMSSGSDGERKAFELFRYDGQNFTPEKFILLQYSFIGKPHAITGQAHGNSKSGKAFTRTKPGVLESIKGKVKASAPPSQVYDEVFEEAGGLLNVCSISDIPRNRKQVENAKYQGKAVRSQDELYDLTLKSKDEEETGKVYIRRLQVAPSPACVLASNRQVGDVKRFCANATLQFSILSIDTTFNIGISSEHCTAFLHDIFGSDFKQEKGLIDSDGCEDFDAKLDSLQEVWNSREKKARGTALSESSAAEFHAYFVTHVSQE